MNRIKTETGTSIIIPPDEEKSDVIRIEGDPKGVAAAKTMLLEMSAKMVSNADWEIFNVQKLMSLAQALNVTKFSLDAVVASVHPATYRIAGKFGGELNLAVWRYMLKPPN